MTEKSVSPYKNYPYSMPTVKHPQKIRQKSLSQHPLITIDGESAENDVPENPSCIPRLIELYFKNMKFKKEEKDIISFPFRAKSFEKVQLLERNLKNTDKIIIKRKKIKTNFSEAKQEEGRFKSEKLLTICTENEQQTHSPQSPRYKTLEYEPDVHENFITPQKKLIKFSSYRSHRRKNMLVKQQLKSPEISIKIEKKNVISLTKLEHGYSKEREKSLEGLERIMKNRKVMISPECSTQNVKNTVLKENNITGWINEDENFITYSIIPYNHRI